MSGDMFLGALCGLADAYDDIVDLPRLLTLPDGAVEIHEVSKNGIVCRHVEVIDRSEEHAHVRPHHHGHEDDHHHHREQDGDHPHRRLSDILAIIDRADITAGARTIAREIFRLIGEAESEVHGIPLETIHFHEISGIDSIIDIVGSAVLLDRLQIDHAISRPICVGYGTVPTQHGLLPVPAPATAKLLHGMPTYRGEEPGERVTPTGAAILRYLQPEFEDRPVVIEREAYGPGKKDFALANVLRLSVVSVSPKTERLFVVETNLDDCSPELLGTPFQTGLFEAGARDFTIVGAVMKKGRPGFILSVLVDESRRDALADYILEETTTIGVRYYPVERKTLPREQRAAHTTFGEVEVKDVMTPSGRKRRKAEFESAAGIAERSGSSISEVKKAAESEES